MYDIRLPIVSIRSSFALLVDSYLSVIFPSPFSGFSAHHFALVFLQYALMFPTSIMSTNICVFQPLQRRGLHRSTVLVLIDQFFSSSTTQVRNGDYQYIHSHMSSVGSSGFDLPFEKISVFQNKSLCPLVYEIDDSADGNLREEDPTFSIGNQGRASRAMTVACNVMEDLFAFGKSIPRLLTPDSKDFMKMFPVVLVENGKHRTAALKKVFPHDFGNNILDTTSRLFAVEIHCLQKHSNALISPIVGLQLALCVGSPSF